MAEGINQVLRDFLVESQENLEQLGQEFVALEHDPDNKELLDSIFRTFHSIKGGAGFLNLTRLEQISHYAEDVLTKLRDHSFALDADITTVLLHAVDGIKSILVHLEKTAEEGEHNMQEVVEELNDVLEGRIPSQEESPSLPPNLPHQGGGTASPTPGPSQEGNEPPTESAVVQEEQPKEEKMAATEQKIAESMEHVLSSVEDTRIHVDLGLLDQLMNLTGELVLARNRVVQFAGVEEIDPQMFRTVAQRLNVVVSELQETMLKTRMQPVKKVFGILPRLVRDLSKAHGKDVELRLEGQDTELDRTLLEALKDPLTHLVRNAIDHGIESPDVRRQQGKPPTGTITITAYHEGGYVHIDIADDGAGIDLEPIKVKALEEGLITPQRADEISERELLHLVFRPGFSTSTTVTDLSGRGVGMDVVKRNLDRIGGIIELHTERQQGTMVKLRIPITLAIIPVLIVKAANHQFAIPQVHLEELIMPQSDNGDGGKTGIETVSGAEVYRLRGELLPLLRLNQVLQLSPPPNPSHRRGTTSPSPNPSHQGRGITPPYPPQGGNKSPLPWREGQGEGEQEFSTHAQILQNDINIVVVSAGSAKFGIIVDDVGDTEEIVVKPLSSHIQQLHCYDGATIMGDGKVALILNVNGLFTSAQFDLEDLKQAGQTETKQEEQVLETSRGDQRQTIVLFRAGQNEYYGVPLAFVVRLEEFPVSQIEMSGGREVLQYRGEVLPLMRLEPYLNLEAIPDPDLLSMIVFSVEKRIGLVVQEILNTVEISTHIDTETFQQKGVLGSTIVDGHSVLILDIHGLIEMAYPAWYKTFFVSKLSDAEREQIRVLLVDDSRFFLNIEKSYLESAGYQVMTATHGQEAIEILERRPVDVVVTDISMPHCDGYELTKTIRSRDEWQHLPVMALTVLSGEEDRKKGITVGIDEYKIKLDRDDVLQALERLILRTRKNA